MNCHYCDEDADIAVEKDLVRVGLCERHFREQVEQLAESEELADIRDLVDIDQER